MEDIKKMLEDVILHDLQVCDQDELDNGNDIKEAMQRRSTVNDLIKTYDMIVNHERELELKERELDIRVNELKLGVGSEVNKLVVSAAGTASDIHKTNSGVRLAATAMDFEKGGNMFAGQISRTIPGIISKMVR